MTLQQIINQTETLSQQDFLEYIYRLPEIAQKKFNLNIFLQNIGKQKNENIETPKNERRFDKFKGKIIMADDFDEPLEDFNEYMY